MAMRSRWRWEASHLRRASGGPSKANTHIQLHVEASRAAVAPKRSPRPQAMRAGDAQLDRSGVRSRRQRPT